MRQPQRRSKGGKLTDLLVLDRLMTGPITRLMYWAGLAMIALFGFSVIGAFIGVVIRDPVGWLLALPALVLGLLAIVVLVVLWRGFCEFYLAVFQIAEDLRALREATEASQAQPRAPESFPPNP